MLQIPRIVLLLKTSHLENTHPPLPIIGFAFIALIDQKGLQNYESIFSLTNYLRKVRKRVFFYNLNCEVKHAGGRDRGKPYKQETILVYMAQSCLKRRRGMKRGKERGERGETDNFYPRNCYAIYCNLYIKQGFSLLF